MAPEPRPDPHPEMRPGLRPELNDDEVLGEQLGRLLDEADPVPDDLVAFAAASLTWRTAGSELAELLFDSAQEDTVAVRAADAAGPSALGATRLLTFGGGDRGIELEVDGGRLVGTVRPEGRYRVEAQSPAGGATVAVTDAGGMFELGGAGRGPLRLAVFPGAAADPTGSSPLLVTAWFDQG